jgi:hypothetical protein
MEEGDAGWLRETSMGAIIGWLLAMKVVGKNIEVE